MSRPCCDDCGTRIEKNGVCPNCDEAAFIMDWQADSLDDPTDSFLKEAEDGYARARKRTPKPGGEE